MGAIGDDENRKTSQEQMKPLLASPHCSRSTNNGTENDLLGAEPNDADVDNEDEEEEEGKEDAHVLEASSAGLASPSVAVGGGL